MTVKVKGVPARSKKSGEKRQAETQMERSGSWVLLWAFGTTLGFALIEVGDVGTSAGVLAENRQGLIYIFKLDSKVLIRKLVRRLQQQFSSWRTLVWISGLGYEKCLESVHGFAG